MFASELIDPASHPQVQAGHGSALAIVEGVVASLASPEAAADLTLAAWALVHGYAVLCNEVGLEPPERREARATLFARIIAAARERAGVRVRGFRLSVQSRARTAR